MLVRLSIENYALIQRLEIDFFRGLSIITGETGAGKSILLGATGLILGNRVDTQVLFDKTKKCYIEGAFDISGLELKGFFDTNELDFEQTTILRREISPQGKSRAFINDTPVSLSTLKELGDRLVHIHSQHETLTLNDSSFQMAVIDSYASNHEILLKYRQKFMQLNKLREQLDELKEREAKGKEEKNYLQFQYDELVKSNLQEGEDTDAEKELSVLNNSEEIKSNLQKILFLLDNDDAGVLSHISEINTLLKPVSGFSDELGEINKRIDSTMIELRDLAREISGIEQSVHYDADRISHLNERLDLIYRLEQKHRVATLPELIEVQQQLQEKLEGIESLASDIEKLEQQIREQDENIRNIAKKLSDSRAKAIKPFTDEILQMLSGLGMPDGRFSIEHKVDTLQLNGADRLTFLFNANKGGNMMEISKVASGGELSRLMLAVKSLIARQNLLPTIIFDEIDIGISGQVAAKVGDILQKMANVMQVIAITHLPQIAGKGKAHYLVYKENLNNSTYTRLRLLNEDERVNEIARMVSGEKVSQAAAQTAKELLSGN